jgi:ABC-2 type transport system permease protein
MLGAISCSVLVVVKRGDPINWIFSSVGALLAGTMFPVSVMPGWLRMVSSYFPLTHSLEAMRRLLLTGCGIADVSDRIGALAVFVILLVPVTILINGMCISYAQKKGAFSTY